MKITFETIERIESIYSNIVMSFSDDVKTITRCLNNDELALLNDPLQEEYTLEYFSLRFANECLGLPEVVAESANPIQLLERNGEITII